MAKEKIAEEKTVQPTFEFTFDVVNERGKVLETKTILSALASEADSINEVRGKLDKELKPDHSLQFKGFKKL